MYKLFIANKNYSSWSLRPWILMAELTIPFEEILLPFTGTGEFANLQSELPARKVPVLHHEGHKIWDSLAITEYLAERHPEVWPKEIGLRAQARSAACEMHSGFTNLRRLCSMNCGIRAKLLQDHPNLNKEILRISELLTGFLKQNKGPFLFGQNFTAVDAFFAPVAFRQQTYGLKFNLETDDYFSRLRKLKNMIRWYEAALSEKWRDSDHDQDIRTYSKITDDFRADLS